MKSLLLIPVALFLALALLGGCENEGGSTNNADPGQQQKPISPAKPTE